MTTTFHFSPWARGCLLLFAFFILPTSDAQCEISIRRTFGAIKNRVDHALQKVGIKKDNEPAPVRDKQGERGSREGDPEIVNSPTGGPLPPASREPSPSKPDAARSRSKRTNSAVVAKPSPQSRGQSQPSPSNADRPIQQDERLRIATRDAAKTKSNNDSTTRPTPVIDGPEKAANAPDAKIAFAKPVPGKKGFVYAPGVEEDLKNILDVRGTQPGQKMRDPRTGNVFLVP